jgi:serine phosphatase RsbU (regulator of sigma subunit)
MTSRSSDTAGHNGDVATEALELALQRSEYRRLGLLLLALATLTCLGLLRLLTDRTLSDTDAQMTRVLVYCGGIAYAMGLAWTVRRAERRGRVLPVAVWFAGTIIESLLPTLALAASVWLAGAPGGAPLRSTPLLLYGLVICLSILRLRPGLCLLSGLVAGSGYLTLIVRTTTGGESGTDWVTVSDLLGFVVFILLTALAAVLICHTIRGHVVSALREAETRRRLAAVQRELELAQTIQQDLLPKAMPQISGFDVAAWNRPAEYASGDYYDWRLAADGRHAFIIADVCGHGLGPALLMASCSAYARAVLAGVSDPARVLELLNRLLQTELASGRFITLALAVLDAQAGVIELASAGHGPMLHISTCSGDVSALGATGMPLGISDCATFGPTARIKMKPGDQLVLLTDGFFERRGEGGQQYGMERLRQAALANRFLPARDFIAALDADVDAFAAGVSPDDDMTAVVIRRRASDDDPYTGVTAGVPRLDRQPAEGVSA